MRFRRIILLLIVIIILIFTVSCSNSTLKGDWVSDANSATELCFTGGNLFTVKTGDTTFNGTYSVEDNKIEMTITGPASAETIVAYYEIVEKNKLLLTNINGETEQFLRK